MVRPLSRVAARTCARPGCPSPASATLRFRYEAREVHLDDLAEERQPEAYDLCVGHADRTGPPHGWSLEDRRTSSDDVTAGSIGGDGTVALLAQMLGRDRGAAVARTGAATEDAGQPRLFDGHQGGVGGETRADAW